MLVYVPLSIGEYSTEVRTFAPVAPGDTDAGDVAWCRSQRDAVRAAMGSAHAGDTASFLEVDTDKRERRVVELSIAEVSRLKRLRGGMLCAVDAQGADDADVIDMTTGAKVKHDDDKDRAKPKAKTSAKKVPKRK